MDTQTLLVLILLLLTINVLFVGVYIVLVLKEVRGSVLKVNRILDTVSELSAAVARPIVGLSGAVEGFTEGLKIFQAVKNIKKMVKKGSEEEE
ncbi:MAG: hypothetical protein AAB486_02535 [Patescibacteria group bacterium]